MASNLDSGSKPVDIMTRLEAFQRIHGDAVTLIRSHAFMIDYLRLMRGPFPDVVRNGLEVGERYVNGEAASQALADARKACWHFLYERSATSDFQNPLHCLVRATICFLVPDFGKSDVVDSIGFFLGVCDRIEDHSAELDSLLDKHFGA